MMVKMENCCLKSILEKSRVYVSKANKDAGALHDDADGGFYMEYGQYEIMRETEELIADIDKLISIIDKLISICE